MTVTAPHEPSCPACPPPAGGVLCTLTGEALQEFERASRTTLVSSGTVLFREGEPIRDIHVASEGMVKMVATSPNGRAVVVSLPPPGAILDAAGVLAQSNHTATAETLAPVHVTTLSRRAFHRLMTGDPALSLRVACDLADELCQTQGLLVDQAVGSRPQERLRRLLGDLALTYGRETKDGTRLDLPLDGAMLGQCIGAARETASRALAHLQREGVVRLVGRRIVLRA